MASLRLSEDLASSLETEIGGCGTSLSVAGVFSNPAFYPLFNTVRELLSRHHYVHISNVSFSPRREVLEALAGVLGVFRPPVENTKRTIEILSENCNVQNP